MGIARDMVLDFFGKDDQQLYDFFYNPTSYNDLEFSIERLKEVCRNLGKLDVDGLINKVKDQNSNLSDVNIDNLIQSRKEEHGFQKRTSELFEFVKELDPKSQPVSQNKTGDSLDILFNNQGEKGKDTSKKQLN